MSKGLELLEKTFGNFKYLKSYEIIEKELKALEIIKKKGVWLPALKLTASFEEDNLEEYNAITIKKYCLPYTQEEYDIVKEIML